MAMAAPVLDFDRGHFRGRRPYQRGRGRGRGRGGGGYVLWRGINKSHCLKTWLPTDLQITQHVPAQLVDFEVVASFNYLTDDQRKGSGISPGLAPVLQNWKGGQLYKRMENYADTTGPTAMRLCLETLMNYWEKEQKIESQFERYDIICTKRALNRLFRFCAGSISGVRSAYRVDIQRIGDTLIMDRSNEEPDSMAKYIVDFFDKMAKQHGPPPHGRFVEMLGYKLGNIKLLVRNYVDAAEFPQEGTLSSDDALVDQLSTLHIDDTTTARSHRLKVSREHADYSILTKQRKYERVDLSTRSSIYGGGGDETQGGKWPNLFFGAATKLVYGLHEYGNVKQLEQYTIEQIERGFETDYKFSPTVPLSKMVTLLNDICETIRQESSEKELYSLICVSGERQSDGFCSPTELKLMKRFEVENVERFL